MAIPKILNFTDYNRYRGETNATKNSDMQAYMLNQNDILKAIVEHWFQPQKRYELDSIVHSNSMPAGKIAIVTTAGTTGTTEPTWKSSGTVTSGTVVFTMKEELGEYLPSSGGTLSGGINYNSTNATIIKRATDDTSLTICGATSYNKGAYIELDGQDSAYGSRTYIGVRNANDMNYLTVMLSGVTTGKNLTCGVASDEVTRTIYARSKNAWGGISASSNGNVGVWDALHNKWVIYNDTNGNTYVQTPVTNDNSNKVATTSYVQNNINNCLKSTNVSLAENGYEQLSNGLMIQWGKTSEIGSTTSVSFPVPFTTVLNVTATPIVSGGSFNASGNNMSIKTVSNNGFTAGSADTSRGYAGFYWFAIGKK